jgi:hypothetical protein
MVDKRTMTLNLTEAEMQALECLAERKELTKTAVIRMALKLFQLIDERKMDGGKLFVEDKDKQKTELALL